MAREGRTPWTVVARGTTGTRSGYEASLVRLRGTRREATLINALDWFLSLLSSTTPGIEGADPAYRVLVTKAGTDLSQGVDEAHRRDRAEELLRRVDARLVAASPEEAQAEFSLDF